MPDAMDDGIDGPRTQIVVCWGGHETPGARLSQTTICVLGPSIPSSIASGIRMFRDEFLVHVKEGGCPHG